jgi:hypothetical protein
MANTSYSLPVRIIDAVKALGFKNKTNAGFEVARILDLYLETESAKPAREKLAAPIIDTTMPTDKGDFINRFSCAIDLDRLFEYIEEDKANVSDETIDQAVFLIQFECMRRRLDGNSWQTFDAMATERLRRCSGLRVPVLKSMHAAMEYHFGRVAFAQTEIAPIARQLPQPVQEPQPFELLPWQEVENVDEIISEIASHAGERATLAIGDVKDRGDFFYMFIVFDGKVEEHPVAMRVRLFYQNNDDEEIYQQFKDVFEKHRSAINDRVFDIENIASHRPYETADEFKSIVNRNWPQIPENSLT